MRFVHRCCLTIALLLILPLTPSWAKASDRVAPAGTVKSIVGQAYVERQGTTLAGLAGQTLQRGDRLVTGDPGGLSLTLVDDTSLTLGADSQIELTEVRFNAATKEGRLHIKLLKGALHVHTGQIARSAPQNVRIETPTGVVGVRGTAFIVEGKGRP